MKMTEKDALDKAYAFVAKMKDRADYWDGAAPMWYGWVLREAFLAGIEYVTIGIKELEVSEVSNIACNKH